jgi:hypothetical protein
MLKDLRIIQREGLLDSITPYLISFTRHANLARFKSANARALTATVKADIRPISADVPTKKESTSIDYPIVIHISDEMKGVYQDFQCLQSILVQEMGYFSLIMSKGQKLHDMDITIHCDVTIFEWLMKWIHFNTQQNLESPQLGKLTY